MCFTVYLSGEIHSDWRDTIISSVDELGLPIEFESPQTDHDASDAAGDMLGSQSQPFWRDLPGRARRRKADGNT